VPVLEVHLVEGDHSPDEHARVLALMSRRYAEVLGSPLQRVRAAITLHRREHWAVGGETGGAPAP
jgi:phenylpyruvate tautomerase PptA (4-oxalocrotonate tautomerase family)